MSISLKHTFVTSDHHFGSWQLLSPFQVFSQEQEKELIEKWNLAIGKDDFVYYNGDFHDGGVESFCNYARQLNGKIILVKGNHDILPDDVYRAVFADVVDEVVLDDLGIAIHHCPRDNCNGMKEIYGHVHRGNFADASKLSGFCSCVQSNDGWPMSLEQVMMSFR